MQIKINGVIENIAEEELHIARLLEIRDVESPEMVSVQLNGGIIDRVNYGETAVLDNDEVEFLYFMGGGSN
ncbi:MAG: sulfur carrier protein ThiS [Deltaproteobacteria bacterium]|nr:sulfur carrier protein ThiS [Deltaproteobacteria bacterium]